MKEKIKVFEVQRTITIEEKESERFILEFNEEVNLWEFHAPNASKFSETQLEEILKKLKELNGEENGN